MATSTTFYVPGPAAIFTGTGASGAMEFLGWSERGVSPYLRPTWRQIDADYAGDVGADQMYAGQSGSCRMTLVNYNEAVLQKLMHWLASAASITAGQGLGSDPAGNSIAAGIGTLANTEGAAVGLVIKSMYNGRANNTTFSMIPGIYFYSAMLASEVELPHSLDVRRVPLSFNCIPVFNSSTGSSQTYTTTLPGSLTIP